MARDLRHEYTELAEMASPADDATASEGRVYQADVTAQQQQQQQQQRRSLAALFRDPDLRRHFLSVACYILLWYFFSALLSTYNKWLFGQSERDFPFPLFVTSAHMLVQYSLASLCLRIFPSLRPSLTPTWGPYLTRVVPCGLASALDVGLSNISLRTITLTFYTMCKSSSLGFVLLFAFLFGLERLRLALVAIISIISVGVVLMAAGEVHFIWAGFLEAIGSSAMSGLRWSLTQILLSQARFGMNNPLATMANLTPIIGISMLVFSLILENPLSEISANKNADSLQGALFIALMMVAGGLLAFAMVLSEFLLISRTSVVTLSIAGMLKEVMIVGVAHLVFGDSMTLVNAAGLLVALFGIGLYNWLKIHDTLNGLPSKEHSSRAEEEEQAHYDHAQQRQVIFVADSYDEVAAVDPQAVEEWSADSDDANSKVKGGISSSVADSAIARRRLSVLPPNHPEGGSPTNETPDPIPVQPRASIATLDSIFAQESELGLDAAQLKPRIAKGDV
ncbi:hypothetical protein GGF46_002836 [Coemansia sp. RSA 552]|nr:hypothetical protein GGF46_002836 [Coemansia sp. RSA 552]